MLLAAGVIAAGVTVPANGAVNEVKQIFRTERFQRGDTNVSRLQEIDDASWIWHPTAVERGEVGKYAFLRFRKEFTADAMPLRFDVSADERFELLLDGAPIAFGPHRGIVENWLYQSYEAKLAPGRHVMEAVVWVLGPYAPSAQLSWRGGFILKAEGEAQAILSIQKALADSLRLLNEASPNDQVIKLKALEAMQKVADGQATKIIIPSELQGLAGLAAGVVSVVKNDDAPKANK